MRRSLAVVAAVSAVLLARGVEAQSILATRGLGYLIQPEDARSRGLGGVALGLPGPQISWANPAAAVGLPAPGLLFAYQYDNYSADQATGSFDGTTARFPLLLAAFPAGERMAFQVGFGSFLDQNWSIQETDTIFLEPAEPVQVVDWSQSVGGVTRLRFGAGWAPVTEIALGLGLDVYTGSVQRIVGRSFPGERMPACCTANWDYSGVGLTAGARWSPTDDSGVALSVSLGGDLAASPVDSIGVRQEWSLPLSVQGGASGRVGTATLVAIAGSWTGWSDLNGDLTESGGARNSWSVNGGVEWDGITISDRAVPLRLGARTETLPFRWLSTPSGSWPRETALSLGAGTEMGGGATRSDAFVEIGSRGGDAVGLDESFWRMGFSIRVLGR